MKIQTVLYYRYLSRQTLVMVIATLIIALIICLVFSLYPVLAELPTLLITSLIWILPLYALVMQTIWFVLFYKSKKQLKNLDLFYRMKNDVIRNLVVKSGKRIKYLIPSKDQEKSFFDSINPEIEKQKKLLAIKKGEYK